MLLTKPRMSLFCACLLCFLCAPAGAQDAHGGHGHGNAEHAHAGHGAHDGVDASREPFLHDIVQLTGASDFGRAGEAYFSPDSDWIIFQAVPAEDEAQGGRDDSPIYSMYVARLVRDDAGLVTGIERPIRVSEPGSANTCGWFHPALPGVVLFGSTIEPASKERGEAYAREGSRYSWEFPVGMEVVTRTVPEIVRASVDDPSVRERLLARPDVGRSVPLWERRGYDAEGSWSPDGRFVLYTQVDAETGDGDIYVRDLASGRSIALVTEPGYDGGPFFSPDGSRICYRSDRKRDDILQLFVADLEFDRRGVPSGIGREVQLTDDGHVNWAPFWHPSGEYLLYATSNVGHHNYEVFAIASELAAGGAMPEPVRVTNAEGFDGLPVFNRDGSLMMWTGQRDAHGNGGRTSQLYLARVEDRAPGDLVLPEKASVGSDTPIARAFANADTETRRYHEHVTILASEWLQGRYPGTPGIEVAEDYIEYWFERAGIAPVFGTAAEASYKQPFELAEHGTDRVLEANNIGGILRGRGHLARRYIVIGAHHDHLGLGFTGSMTGTSEVHDGADDNASGTAAVMLLAERLASAYRSLPADAEARSIVFVTFSAEELGLNGSRHFVRNPPIDLGRCDLMVNFDMIGRVTNRRVSVAGMPSGEGFDALFSSAIAAASELDVVTPEGLSSRSDHAAFYDAEVPVLFVSIDPFHTDYHTPEDESWKINATDATRAVRLVDGLVMAAATHGEEVRFVEMEHYDRGPSIGVGDVKVRFGIMPGNYNDTEPGIVVQRVSAGTSADEGGVVAGDRLMRWDGELIESVSVWMELMAENSPGDVVDVTVLRDGETVILPVTLKASGGE